MSLDALAEWLATALGVAALEIESSGAPPLNGASNETLMVRASWTVDGVTQQGGFVVRRPPVGPTLYETYDLAGQYATMQALAGTGVPVPPLLGYEPDPGILGAPFYVMHEVAGKAPEDLPPFTRGGWVMELPAARQSELYANSIGMLARIHRLEASRLPLQHLAQGFDAQLAATESWHHWAAAGRANRVLDDTLDWLLSHQPMPSPAGLNWGDARIGNMLYQGLSPVAVLDWEMAALGPPEVDLGWWLFLNRHHTTGLGLPTLPGFPDDATTVAMWESAAEREAQDVFYFDVLAGLRFGIIVARASRRMIELGQLAEEQSFERVNGATALLAQMLDLPEPA